MPLSRRAYQWIIWSRVHAYIRTHSSVAPLTRDSFLCTGKEKGSFRAMLFHHTSHNGLKCTRTYIYDAAAWDLHYMLGFKSSCAHQVRWETFETRSLLRVYNQLPVAIRAYIYTGAISFRLHYIYLVFFTCLSLYLAAALINREHIQ